MKNKVGLKTKIRKRFRDLEITYDGEKIFSNRNKKNLDLSEKKINHRKFIIEFPARKKSIRSLIILNILFSIPLFGVLNYLKNVLSILVLVFLFSMCFLLLNSFFGEVDESRIKIRWKNQKSFDDKHPDYVLNKNTRGSREIVRYQKKLEKKKFYFENWDFLNYVAFLVNILFIIILGVIRLFGLFDKEIMNQPDLTKISLIFYIFFTIFIYYIVKINNKCQKGYQNIKRIIENDIYETRREVSTLRFLENIDTSDISDLLDEWYKYYNALYFEGDLKKLNYLIIEFNVLLFPLPRLLKIIISLRKYESRLKLLKLESLDKERIERIDILLNKIAIYNDELEHDSNSLKSDKLENRAKLNLTQTLLTIISSILVTIITILTIQKYGI